MQHPPVRISKRQYDVLGGSANPGLARRTMPDGKFCYQLVYSAPRPAVPRKTKPEQPKETEPMPPPVSQNPAFQTKWAALRRQLENIRYVADMHNPSPTQIAEAVSVARYYLEAIETLMLRKDQPAKEIQP